MSSTRAKRLTEIVKQYEPTLYVKRTENGMLQVWRKEYSKDISGVALGRVRELDHFILALTDNWSLRGTPVDWGIEPLMARLKMMDSWRDDSLYEKSVEERNKIEDLKTERFKRELKHRAVDIRKDVAKATNDIIVQS